MTSTNTTILSYEIINYAERDPSVPLSWWGHTTSTPQCWVLATTNIDGQLDAFVPRRAPHERELFETGRIVPGYVRLWSAPGLIYKRPRRVPTYSFATTTGNWIGRLI